MSAHDLIGKRFGRLVVTGFIRRLSAICVCDCGKTCDSLISRLFNGGMKSCGCRRRNKKHLKSKTKVYRAWAQMKDRCQNKNYRRYDLYGGRGISVCERWDSFENFFADMGEPLPRQSIDRIDNNGNYEPGNCRWTTMTVQSNNKRNNVVLTFRGRSQTSSEWAKEFGMTRSCLHLRLKAGWDIEKALLTPRRIRIKNAKS